ncbi:MAG: thrombospondin type 3 repeat-containing protein, partial [Candidatus Poseidoniia archaeon]|nr:thrombospondin type 3 repeat-containing protein [Candidatus Poseidoniia archaeon]
LDEQQRELFVEFYTPGANVYTITVEILVPAGKDFFPENNTMTVSFRVLDTFFSDGFDIDNNGYTEVQRTTSEENRWLLVHKENYAYSGEYAYQYAEDETHDSENPTTAGGSDDGLITMDEWDRDGESDKFGPDVNLDLRAAYKPILNFAIKWDFANDDRLEVRAATDFDSTDKHNSGTWIVLKTYEGDCGCPMLSEDKETWVLEELSLESFEGYRTWIEFRVITNTGGGKGVLIDDLAVLGNEYRNNIMITEVGLGDQSPELDNELSVTIRGAGLEPQESVTVAAKILDVNGQQVWPTTSEFTWFTISETLSKSEEYIVNIDTAGSDWKYGSELEEGTYFINVMAFRDDDLQVPDENPNNNMWFEEFVLVKIDADSDGVTDDIDECLGTPSDEEVDAVGCSNSQKDSDGDNITDDIDECLETPSGEEADTVGCSNSQKDSDSDNITDDIDECPSTASGEEVDQLGCSPSQKDSDNDGVSDAEDQCPDTLSDEEVGEAGCSSSQKDSDNDGISDAGDKCLNTPVGKQVDEEGCSNSQKDSDNDGITDDKDECDSPSGEKVDELGCKFEEPVVNDNTIVSDTGSNNTNLDDSGPIVESLDEEEIEVPSLGLIAVIFSVFSIAVLRRR